MQQYVIHADAQKQEKFYKLFLGKGKDYLLSSALSKLLLSGAWVTGAGGGPFYHTMGNSTRETEEDWIGVSCCPTRGKFVSIAFILCKL
jgi:hypothetical protein